MTKSTEDGTGPEGGEGGAKGMAAARAVSLLFLTLFVTGPGFFARAQQPPARSATSQPVGVEAERVLARARQAVGGAERLTAVKSLVVEGTRTRSPGSPYSESEAFGFKLLRPGRYQSLASAYRHTIDGDAFWMHERAGDIVIDNEIRAIAERSTRWSFIQHSLLFLLSVPESARSEVRYVGAVPNDPDGREWIDVTASGFRFPLSVGFDRDTGLPAALRTTSSLGVAVLSLGGYKAVDGILFPFTLEDRIGDHVAVTTISIIKVNAGVDASDFVKR